MSHFEICPGKSVFKLLLHFMATRFIHKEIEREKDRQSVCEREKKIDRVREREREKY